MKKSQPKITRTFESLANMKEVARVSQKQLEEWVLLPKARDIIDRTVGMDGCCSNKDVHQRNGVIKIILEEYRPLVAMASSVGNVHSLRLMPMSNPGPDAEIRYQDGRVEFIQITCTNEGYGKSLIRERLSQGEVVFAGQSHTRNKATKSIYSIGRALVSPESVFQKMLQRILNGIEKKNTNYHENTETLLIQEDSKRFSHLEGLHEKITEEVSDGIGEKYTRIYIVYGDEVERAK